jgi:hypothetical protein
VDFGDELTPHLLEAVAFGPSGSELGRARQWVNLALHEAEVTIVLDHDRDTGRVEARLSWQTITAEEEPVAVSAVFDGRPLQVSNPRVVVLPAHDPELVHHLRVELEFAGSIRAQGEITFGGRFGESVSSELTPFPVFLAKGGDQPSVEAMDGWFHSRGRSVPVDAVEKGLAEIVVVRDSSAQPYLEDLLARQQRTPSSLILRKDHRLRLVGVRPLRRRHGTSPFVVFPRSAEITDRVGGLLLSLTSVKFPTSPSSETRLADAAAVAGLFASQSGRRRAVVVITTTDSRDASQFGPRHVRRYLRRLGVPLVVWSPETGATDLGDWGIATNVSNPSLMSSAYRRLSRTLDRQRIVWLGGLHLPQRIGLNADVADPAVNLITDCTDGLTD